MSEGELKKQIGKLLEDGADMQYTVLACKNNAEFAGVLRVGIKPSIIILLDEAKKELTEAIQEINDTTALTIGQKQLAIFIDWFEKWFGEQP